MANNLGEFQMAKRKRRRLFIAKDKAATNLPTQWLGHLESSMVGKKRTGCYFSPVPENERDQCVLEIKGNSILYSHVLSDRWTK